MPSPHRRAKPGAILNSVRLVVVTKLHPIEIVQAAIEAGAQILGENYPEEAVQKITELKSQTAVKPSQFAVEWHIIGHVQSRKARLVAEHFALFQSLDSLKLAEHVDHFAAEFNRVLPVLLEFNVGDEESKSGWLASDETRWADLLNDVNTIASLKNLQVRGLMTMPPLFTDPEAARPYFQRLRRLQRFSCKARTASRVARTLDGHQRRLRRRSGRGRNVGSGRAGHFGSRGPDAEIECFFVAEFIHVVAQILILLVIVSAILSCFMSPFHPVRQAIDRIVDPLLCAHPARCSHAGGFDFSPLILMILIELIDQVLTSILLRL